MPLGPPHIVHTPSLDTALAETPDCPAVFLIHVREGEPYLGRTALLRRRLRRLLSERSAVTRVLNLRGIAERIEYWPTGSRLESALVQYELATRHFPETYVDLLKLRMPPYVKLLLSNPYPRTQVTTKLAGGPSRYYGPFRTRASAELFEQSVLELFQVRRCTEDLEPSTDHPGCIYGEMNLCLRPCQLAVSAEEYRTEVMRVASFLESGGRSLVEPLEGARSRFSEQMMFEEAARVHKRLEKIEQVTKLRDDLVCDIEQLNGVAITAAADGGAVQLWFMQQGVWLDPVRFGFEAPEGRAVSMDHRLREIADILTPPRITCRQKQEHIALLARWYYSRWRDGDWLAFAPSREWPYRRMVRAIGRVMALKPPASPATSV